ncbi:MAG: adenosylcobalamin-dependent ribonucleoside-diphosphate reductase [Candidatus Omnitrophica bacterium]|nr:adenosylcobalamin-dependent ribonucleoside-diphosphate reductase [Candidatus Omnitrophota bacterium]MBD3269071.1 adenosylcobalamin-dependent ribonucleoside-diphosphate reductase [Candidatus Omnitrophota bacterium]
MPSKLRNNIELSKNSLAVLKKRYLLKDENRNVIEAPAELFLRVAKHVSSAEKKYKTKVSPKEAREVFYRMMSEREFMPNSPTLMNAGTYFGQLSACFVLPVEDSMDGIFNSLHNMAKIHQSGGGTGFDFSKLRPRGDLVSTTKGEASGPVSFMEIFDKSTGVIVQGGRRRGANMGILRCDHPDIIDFIQAKSKQNILSNFNLSVGATDKFMRAVNKNTKVPLINPRTGGKTKEVKAGIVFDLIVEGAWKTGDPGLIFLDEINRENPTPSIGRIEATNPCGELPLLPYESCNLASVNLERMLVNGKLNWEKLKRTVHWGVRFLDNVITVNKFPLQEIKEITFANRKIGLGVMGFADMLYGMNIAYTSDEALKLADKIMDFIHKESVYASAQLASERGAFPNFRKSVYAERNIRMRNATVNTIAPTGTISIIAGCSSGIEPVFALSFVRNILSGNKQFEINPVFERRARRKGFYNKELLSEIARKKSLKNIKGVPQEVKRVFETAFDVPGEQHLRVQAAFQRHTDNSVSKTINLPQKAGKEDIKKIYIMAHKLRCKGITIYRYGSKEGQVISFPSGKEEKPGAKDFFTASSEYSGGCAGGTCQF